MKFAAQGTRPVGEKQSPDPELRSQNHKRMFSPSQAGSPPGDTPPALSKAFGPKSVPASWGRAAQETSQSWTQVAGEGRKESRTHITWQAGVGTGTRAQASLLPSPSFSATLCPSLPRSEAEDKEEASWLHRGATEAAGGSPVQGQSWGWPPTLPQGDRAPRPHGSRKPLKVRTPGDAHLLQCVHHGLQVHALGELFLPSARAKRDRWSDGGLPMPVKPSDTMPAPTQARQAGRSQKSISACPPGAPTLGEGDSQVDKPPQ